MNIDLTLLLALMHNITPREVPTYTSTVLKPKQHVYCIVVFVINEGERIQRQLHNMRAYTSMVDVIVADGGSTDGSLSSEILQATEVRALLTKRGPGKLSAQMRMAIDYALTEGYEGIIVIDGNNKDDVSAVPLFVQGLQEGYDHIQGSRFVLGGVHINTPLSRLWGVRILHAPLVSLAAGKRHTDTTNGFRAYSTKLLADPRIQPLRDIFQTYELHYYLAIRASRLGFKTCEVPVTRSYPKKGKTPTKISPIKGNLHVLKVLFQACIGRFDPK